MTPIIIPAYEPDTRMNDLLETMKERRLGPVIIVDDGSGKEYADLFAQAQEILRELGGTVLTHEVNRGKGRGLKTAFAHILEAYPDAAGCVTADSDGQHTVDCILSVRQALEENPDKLILGVRRFDGEGVPWKSRPTYARAAPSRSRSAWTPCVRPMTGVSFHLRACASSVAISLRQSARRMSIAWRMLIA